MIIEQSVAVWAPFLLKKSPLSPATEHQGRWEFLIHNNDKIYKKNLNLVSEGKVILFLFSAEKKSNEATFHFFSMVI